MRLIVVASLLFCFAACQVEPSQNAPRALFFDIPSFFEQECAQLGSREIQKTIQQNGKTETKNIKLSSREDWAREFALFSRVQLNRPSFSDKYKIDSLFGPEGQLQQLRYTAKNPDQLYTQSVQVFFEGQQPTSIQITNYNDNLLSPTLYTLQYDSRKGYHIQQSQTLPFSSPTDIQIDALFL